FFFYRSAHHRALHSFPTRRSSDLSSISFSANPIASEVCASMRTASGDLGSSARRRVRFRRSSLGFCGFLSGSGGFFCSHSERSRSEEHTSELQSQSNLVCRLLLEK